MIEAFEICVYHVIAKLIMSCRYRGMSSKHRACRHRLERSSEFQPALHQHAHALQHHEGCMAFIDVPYTWPESDVLQGPDAAHAEEDFLLDAHGRIAGIKLVSMRAVIRQDGRMTSSRRIKHGGAVIV